MKITAFSMTPLFPDKVMGGAQKQLYTVMMHLAQQGHQITVLCTRREPDVVDAFQWHENARVVPAFRFKQPFPEPYAVPIFHIANAIQDIRDYLDKADVFYSHDGGFIFPYIHQTVPTVTSLRSVIFSETLQSAFLFQGDDLILISQHQRDTVLNTVGRFFPVLAERTHVIYNGLDFDVFKPTPTTQVRQLVPDVDPNVHAIALYPHRPEAPKGIIQVVEVANLLVHRHQITNLRVLVPRWIEEALSPEDKIFYDNLKERIAAYGLNENFVFHPWVSQPMMPAYYSLGHVTFAIGSYVETFGNVPYESLACGTPAVLARVGPARELLPDALVDKVDPLDNDEAASIAARIMQNRERTRPETLAYLKEHFDVGDMVSAYADVILNARKREPMPFVHHPLTSETAFHLAPWCVRVEAQIYNDFTAAYTNEMAEGLDMLFHLLPGPFTLKQAQAQGLTEEHVMHWYREGLLVPQFI